MSLISTRPSQSRARKAQRVTRAFCTQYSTRILCQNIEPDCIIYVKSRIEWEGRSEHPFGGWGSWSRCPGSYDVYVKGDWRSRTCSQMSGQAILSSSEFFPRGIHRNVSIMFALPHRKTSFRFTLFMASFCTALTIVLLSASIIMGFTCRKSR